MFIFGIFIIAFIASIQIYLLRKLTLYIETTRFRNFSKILPGIFVALNLPTFFIIADKILKFQNSIDLAHPFILYSFSIWQGTTIFIFLAMMTAKLISLFTKPIFKKLNKNKIQNFDESRRKFLKTAFFGISAYAFAGSTIGTLTRNDYKIERVRIKIENLPDELKGLTIGLISDIHSGIFMTEEDMKEYAFALENLKPDLILLPGDFITSDPEEIYPFVNAFGNLKAKYGVFATLGNHEFFTRQPQKIAQLLEKNGIRVLRNESEKIEINGEKIFIIGIDDLRYGADLDKAIKNIEKNKLKILLSHKPYAFEEFAYNQIELTVSGHTHGGQIVFAKIDDTYIAPASLVSKFVAGHYKLGNSHLYVTRGVGVVGLPIRFNCPPEITHITLF